ncbi:MAG: NAD(+) diphosphatase [Spirochaetaceae bacterium]|jgi:NAD+ diphosphatase|nr:NAD(+) diphosphatase [Spirochaetaceae bacterium]
MHSNLPQKAYLFQGNALVAPAEDSDFRGTDPVPLKRIADAFGEIEIFTVPAVSGGVIRYADIPPAGPLPEGWGSRQVRLSIHCTAGASALTGEGSIGALLRAFHIAQWRRDSAFCGTCGTRNADAKNELARLCPHCGRREYPRISPAIIVLIRNEDDRALLAHNRSFAPGVYSLIAGFNEAGETLESTAAREIREEVGLEVRDLQYITSQPWPFPNSLMLGFTARYAGGTIKADGVEIEDARWFSRDQLPNLPGTGSVSRHLINLWLQGKI